MPSKYKKEEMSIFNVRQVIQLIKDETIKGHWQWLDLNFMSQEEASSFLYDDDVLIQKLIKDSQDIKNIYINIKLVLNYTLEKIEEKMHNDFL